MHVLEETRHKQTATQTVEARVQRTRWSGLPLQALQGPPRRCTKDAEMDVRARGAEGYEKWHGHDNAHGASSHSYERSENGMRVDGGSDGPTDENIPDVNEAKWLEHAWRRCLPED